MWKAESFGTLLFIAISLFLRYNEKKTENGGNTYGI